MDKTQNAQDWFGGLGGAQQGGGSGNYFGPGTYTAEITSVTRKVSQDPAKRKARMIIAELRVLDVDSPLPALDGFAASSRVGETCAVICNLDSAYPELDMGRLKGLLTAALGAGVASTDDEWADLAAKVTEPPGHALAGTKVRVTGGRKTTGKGVKIVPVTFAPLPPAGSDEFGKKAADEIPY